MNKLIGYVRVSTGQQEYDGQVADLLRFGVRRDDLYADKEHGDRERRPGWAAALDALQSGDTLVITKLDRLGRTTLNMLKLMDVFNERNVSLVVLNLGGGVVDTRTPAGRMFFTMMSAMAEMELELIRERSRDSARQRREAGKQVGGRPIKFEPDDVKAVDALVASGISTTQAVRKIGMSRPTYYRLKRLLETPAEA